MSDNRRDNVRHDVVVMAEVMINNQLHEGVTRNLSTGGVNVELDVEAPDGERLALTLLLTLDGVEDASAEPFESVATVVWSAPTDSGRWMIGLRFSSSPAQQGVLERFLTTLRAAGEG